MINYIRLLSTVYLELPQMTVVMVNGANANYNLTTWYGAADLRTLMPDTVCTTILEPCLHDGPITLHTAAFNLTDIEVDDTTIIEVIQAKILKLGFKQIYASIFQQLCPGYSNQPHAAIKHICQSAPGPDGQIVTATTIEYYQRMLNAARPFTTQTTYPISECDNFIQGLDRRILGHFCHFYPQYLAVHNLNGAYQCSQLAIILAAAQAAEDEVKQMQEISHGMMGQGFYSNVIGGGEVPAFPSQSKKTLSKYQGGGHSNERKNRPERLPLKCFGCGGAHPWIKDKKIVCSNGIDLAVIKRAKAKYKAYCKRVAKARSRHGGERR
jgi:hypothetical protein